MRYLPPHFLFLILFLAVACRPSSSNSTSKELGEERAEFIADFDLDKIKKRGHLIAIMNNNSTGLFVYKGRTMGYEYELLKRFCDKHELQLRFNITNNLNEAFIKLNAGEGDILAYNLTVTKERKKRIAFTDYLNLQRQVLIQRKPQGWRKMKLHEIEKTLVRDPVELIGKEVYVIAHSSYYHRLVNLSDEIGGDINIVLGESNIETEEIIRRVATGEVDFTVAEEDIARVNATYYPNLDIKTPVSFSTQIAWGVRKNSSQLLAELNEWIREIRKTPDYYAIYDKYFKSSKSALRRSRSKYFSINNQEGTISPYDDLIKEAAIKIGWDWYLLSAQIFKESKFDPLAKSWAGAVGLMQVMPNTAEQYNVTDLLDPEQNVYAGTKQILWLQEQWKDKIIDETERTKFVLASYNVGLGHLQDAVRLTEKYGGDVTKWQDVEEYVLKKSIKKYYTDPVVEYGYCRGTEPVQYVIEIMDIYENYKELIKSELDSAGVS